MTALAYRNTQQVLVQATGFDAAGFKLTFSVNRFIEHTSYKAFQLFLTKLSESQYAV